MPHDSQLNSRHVLKRALRKHIRQQRRSLSPKQQHQAELGIARYARQCRQLWQAEHVLSYAPFQGEAAPHSLISALKPRRLYLPRITNYQQCRMQFYHAGRLSKHSNAFGIIEPRALTPPIAANQLQLALIPLVAFDRSGNRLGMGAGYYDRAFQALAHQTGNRPLLVGIAHTFQETESLQAKPWDVPLDAILTESEYIPISPNL